MLNVKLGFKVSHIQFEIVLKWYFSALTLENLVGAFCILASGLVLACVVALIEMKHFFVLLHLPKQVSWIFK